MKDPRRVFEYRRVLEDTKTKSTFAEGAHLTPQVNQWAPIMEAEIHRRALAYYDGPHYRVLHHTRIVRQEPFTITMPNGEKETILQDVLIIRMITIDEDTSYLNQTSAIAQPG